MLFAAVSAAPSPAAWSSVSASLSAKEHARVTIMAEFNTGDGLIELRYPFDDRREILPIALVREAIRALPDDSEIREKLRAWTRGESAGPITRDELQALEQQLAEFAHGNRSELGEVGRLPQAASGGIVGTERWDIEPVSATVVLALAIRRLVLLHGLGGDLVLVKQEGETAT